MEVSERRWPEKRFLSAHQALMMDQISCMPCFILQGNKVMAQDYCASGTFITLSRQCITGCNELTAYSHPDPALALLSKAALSLLHGLTITIHH